MKGVLSTVFPSGELYRTNDPQGAETCKSWHYVSREFTKPGSSGEKIIVAPNLVPEFGPDMHTPNCRPLVRYFTPEMKTSERIAALFAYNNITPAGFCEILLKKSGVTDPLDLISWEREITNMISNPDFYIDQGKLKPFADFFNINLDDILPEVAASK